MGINGDWISQLGNNTFVDVRVFITAFVIVAVASGIIVARRGRQKLQETMPNELVNVIVVGATATFLVLATVTLLYLWNVVNASLVFFTNIDILKDFNGISITGAHIVQIVLSVIILATAYIVAGVAQEAIDRFTRQHERLSRHQAKVLDRLTRISVYLVAFATVLSLWDFDLTGLLVGAGFLGIVVGMAARQTLGSLLAGFMLMFARPFEIGDWVEIEEKEGIVTDISIFNTRIQTFDGEFVMIPNEVVGGSTITNRSRKGRLRLEVDVGVDYDADIEQAAELAESVMGEVDDALTVPSPEVVTKEFADSAIVLGLRFWIDKPSARRKWRARTEIMGAVKEAFEREDIKIPYPQRELSGRQETGGFRVARKRQRELGPTADGGEDTGPRSADKHGESDDGDER